MTAPVVVIGAGLAGLATAARLAKNGHPVELFERSSSLGGMWAATELRPGILAVVDGFIGVMGRGVAGGVIVAEHTSV